MRWVFIGAGLIALAASTTMALNAAGGLSASVAPGLIAMAFVLAVGAAAIGHALARRHLGLALVIGLGMTAGEVGAMIQTAQRVTAAREAQRAPFVALEEKRRAALAELAAAEHARLEPVSPARLEAAIAAKAAAERTVAEKAAEKGCRENCRMLLQSAVDAAVREVDAARAGMVNAEEQQVDAIAARLANAKAAIAVLPPPQSATPLADYSGMPEWILDLLEALALSLAINLPASALIALGVKMRAREEPNSRPAIVDAAYEAAEPTQKAITAVPAPVDGKRRNSKIEAERFGVAMLRPDANASLSPSELRAAYLSWCRTNDREPLPMNQIAPALGRMFREAGIAIDADGAADGVGLRS